MSVRFVKVGALAASALTMVLTLNGSAVAKACKTCGKKPSGPCRDRAEHIGQCGTGPLLRRSVISIH